MNPGLVESGMTHQKMEVVYGHIVFQCPISVAYMPLCFGMHFIILSIFMH